MGIINAGNINKTSKATKLILDEQRVNIYSEELTYIANQTLNVNTGVPDNHGTNAWTGYLKVDPNTTYIRNNVHEGGLNTSKRVFYYDINKQPCSVLHTGISEGIDQASEFTTPSDCMYIGTILLQGTAWDVRAGFRIWKKRTGEHVVIDSLAKDYMTGVHNFSREYKNILVVNESKYAPVIFTLSGCEYRIEPSGSYYFSDVYEKTVKAIPIAGKCRVSVHASDGGISPNTNYQSSNSLSKHVGRLWSKRIGDLTMDSIMLIRRNVFILAYDKHLAISVDSGETYINYDHTALLNASESFIRAIITTSDTCLMLTNEGRLFRSTNYCQSFTDVSPAGVTITPWLWRNWDQDDRDNIMFAEYSVSASSHRIFKSSDDGASWSVVLTKTNTEIRHFHSLSFNPYNKKWYATSGDTDAHIKWIISSDYGETWIEKDFNSQLFRTLSTIFTPDGDVIWGVDTDVQFQGYWKANLKELESSATPMDVPQCILPLQSVAWGLEIYENNLIAFTQMGVRPWARQAPSIYLSKDMGKTWDKIIEWPMYSQYSGNGFRSCLGSDLNGNVYITPVLNLMYGLTGLESGQYGAVKIRL